MSTFTPTNPAKAGRPFDPTWFAGAAAIAALLNMLIFWIGKSGGASMTLDAGAYDTITWIMAGGATLAALALGGAVTWFVTLRRPSFLRIALWGGLAIALVSMASPFVVAGDMRTAFSLAAMHIAGAAAWVIGLRSTGR